MENFSNGILSKYHSRFKLIPERTIACLLKMLFITVKCLQIIVYRNHLSATENLQICGFGSGTDSAQIWIKLKLITGKKCFKNTILQFETSIKTFILTF